VHAAEGARNAQRVVEPPAACRAAGTVYVNPPVAEYAPQPNSTMLATTKTIAT
jgi:hypothetical protein